MDPRLTQYITNFLFGPIGNRSNVVEFQRFAEMYVYCVRGTIDDRISVLLASLGKSETETTEIPFSLIKEVRAFALTHFNPTIITEFFQYVEAIVASYMRALRLESGPQYKSWESKGFRVVKECVQKLAESLVCDVLQQGTSLVTRHDAEKWLQYNSTFIKMLESVFSHLYNYRASSKSLQDDMVSVRRKSVIPETNTNLLPFCEGNSLSVLLSNGL